MSQITFHYKAGDLEMVLSPIAHVGLAEETYGRLRDAIFAGEFQPTDKLDIPRLAELFGISTQPVKDALAKLSTEGLVVIVPRKGTYVRTVTKEDAINILNARLMMETWAISHARAVTEVFLENLAQVIETMRAAIQSADFDFSSYNESDMFFHEQLVMLADNPEILRSYKALHSHYVTARYYYKRLDKSIASDDDHRRIWECLRNQQLNEACTIVERHIQAGIDGIARMS
jgi:DNA-binding GntR family transcriptional regulator